MGLLRVAFLQLIAILVTVMKLLVGPLLVQLLKIRDVLRILADDPTLKFTARSKHLLHSFPHFFHSHDHLALVALVQSCVQTLNCFQ
jgi:hypothetical protein